MLAYYRLDKWLFYNSDQHLQERIGTWWYTNSWLQGPLSKVTLWPPQAWTYMHLFIEIIVSLSPSCAGQTVCSESDVFLALFLWVPGSFRTSYETSDVGLPSECPHFPSLPLTEWIEEPPCVPRQAVRESCLTGKQGLLGRCCSNDKAVANKWPKGQILTNGRWPLLKPRLREDPLYIRSTVSQLSLQAKGSCLEFSENPKPWSIYGCCCCVFSQFKLKLLTMTTMMRWFFYRYYQSLLILLI